MRSKMIRTCSRLSLMFCLFLALIGAPKPIAARSLSSNPLRVIESNAQHIILELTAPRYSTTERVIDGTQYLELVVPGGDMISDAGKPRLPVWGTMVALPQGAETAVNILRDETKTNLLDQPLLPAPTLTADYFSDPTLPRAHVSLVADPSVYSAGGSFPSDLVEISEPAQWRSQRYVTLRLNPFQYNPAGNELTIHTRLRVELAFDFPHGADAAELGDAVDEGPFESILHDTLINYQMAKNWRRAESDVVAPKRTDVVSANPVYKIAVDSEGVYKIRCADLQSAGMSLATLDLDTVRISNRGNELALYVQDSNSNNRCNGNDLILFWGEPPATQYSTTNIYWLTYGGGAGKRMTVRPGTGSGTPSASFADRAHLEENKYFIGYLPWSEDEEHWWWIALPNSKGDSADFTFDLTLPVTVSGEATLRVTLGAVSATHHRTRISLNDNELYDETWNGVATRTAEMTFAANLLHAGTNTVRVTETIPSPNTVWINALELEYPGAYAARNDVLRFRQDNSGTWEYQVTGLSGAKVQVWDVSDPFNPELVNAAPIPTGSTYTAQFTDDAPAPREYYALTDAQRKLPLSISRDTSSDLHNPNNGADYIIITPADFASSIQPLADYRATQMRVAVVDVQDVYDEFNGGVMDAQAIHDFLAFAYTHWKPPKPSFVLLVGDGNFNLKNYSSYPIEPNFIPPYLKLVDPWIGMTASDHRLVTLDAHSLLASIAIGRLPALSAADVDAMVAKILNYEQHPPTGDWRSTVTFVADNAYNANGSPDVAGNFWAMSDEVASDSYYFPAPLTADRVYYNPCTNTTKYPWCALPYPTFGTEGSTRAAALDAFNTGRLILNYVGHSAIPAWSHNLLINSDADSLTNGDKTPLLLPMTCYDGYFQFPGVASVSEALVIRAEGGALASWAPTGLGVATRHDILDRGFFEAVFQKHQSRIGAAILFAKARLNAIGGGVDLLDTFNLLGDPATRLAVPKVCAGAPSVPQQVAPRKGADVNKRKVTLKWTGVVCANGYALQVRRNNKKGEIVVNQNQLKKPKYNTTPLDTGKTYVWRVQACNGDKCGKWTAWRKFRVSTNGAANDAANE